MSKKTKSKSRLEYKKEFSVSIGNAVFLMMLTEHTATIFRLKGYKVRPMAHSKRPK